MRPFTLSPFIVFALLYTSLFAVPLKKEAPTFDLQAAIDSAIASQQSELNLPKGQLRVKPVTVTKAKNLVIQGDNTDLIFTDYKNSLITFRNCKNVLLKGVTIDCDPLPFTQAVVTKTSDDHRTLEYKVLSGYPQLDDDVFYGRSGVFVYDPKTYHWKEDVPDLYLHDSIVLSPTEGRLKISAPDLPGYAKIQPGDYLSFKHNTGAGIAIQDCDTVNFEDVTIYTCPGAGFIYRRCEGQPRLTNCKITPGPMPEGATVPRLLSSVADGFNIGYSRKGPIMEGCDFSYMGDDAVNLHGTIVDVGWRESDTVYWTASKYWPEYSVQLRPGDTAQFMQSDSYKVIAEAPIKAFKREEPSADIVKAMRQQLGLKDDQKIYCIRIELTESVDAKEGDHLGFLDVACPDFVFRNNYFHDHRARGLRLGASDGIVENNTFERIKQTAISLGPHAIHHEGNWASNITIKGNTFRDLGFDDRAFEKGSYHNAAVVVQHFLPDPNAEYPQENKNIQIIDNTFENIAGAGILAVTGDGLLIKDNTFNGTQQRDCTDVGSRMRLISTAAISLNYCSDVSLENNVFENPGPYCSSNVLWNPSK